MRHLVIILLVSLVDYYSAHAQSSEPLRLTQALCHELAVKNSEDIRKQQNALQQALLDKKTAFASYLPDFDGSVMAVLMQDTKITDAMSLQMKGTYMAGISLTMPIYTGGKITTANRLAQVGVEVQQIQQERTRQEVICEADKAYFTYQAVRSKVAMLEAYMQQMDSLCASVDRSVGVSMATRSDLLRIEAKRSQVEYNLKKARNGVVLCRMSLCAALGIDLATQVDVEDISSETFAVDSSLTACSPSLATRPEYRLLEQNVKAKQLEIRQARADMLPTFALSAQYSRYGWAYMKGVQEGYSYKTEISGNSPILMATLSIPLWHWGKEQNKVRRAKLEHVNAQLDLQKNARLLAIENQQTLQNLQDSRKMIATAQLGLSQSDDNLRNMRLRFDNSMGTLTDLLDAYSQWQEARSNLIEARTQYKIYETEYRRIIGQI